MTLAFRVLIGLIGGFLLGLALGATSSPAASVVLAILAPIGTVFVNLIRMMVIPLIASMLVANLGSMASTSALGRTVIRAFVISLILLAATALGSALIAEPILARVPIDQNAALALRGEASPGAPAVPSTPTAAQWVLDLVPPNIFQAAANGAILPVILFATLFGFALAHVTDSRREAVMQVVEGVANAMQRLVVWILAFAPIGVFALAAPLAARLGLAAAGAVIAFVALVVALTVVAVALVLYPLGIVAGRMSPSTFTSYCAPSQAIAFAARSSIAALPAMVESAERAGLPPTSSRLVLPVAVAVFHFGAAVGQTVSVLFLAHLYGVMLTAPQVATIVLAVVVASFTVPGIPGGSVVALVPVLSAVNLPLEGVGILLAVDTIPDMFRTTANVTGAMTLTAILRPPQDGARMRA
jgi:Na+/H+-dicarboxylate symporter